MAIELKPIKKATITFWIKGTAPMIQHAWGEKGLTMMRMTTAERRKVKKVARDPEAEAQSAIYRTEGGEYGIPAMAFKSAVISAAHKDIGIEKTLIRKSLFVLCDDKNMVLPMETDEPIVREDIVRVGMSQTDLRYRPEFRAWRVKVTVEVNADALTAKDVVNLVNIAGFGVGIGEWRPEKGGDYGRFVVDESEPVETQIGDTVKAVDLLVG